MFLQITKEGAKDSGEALELMSLDIDALVEGVYKDRMDRQVFHTKFLTFGGALFLLLLIIQLLFGKEEYLDMLDDGFAPWIIHAVFREADREAGNHILPALALFPGNQSVFLRKQITALE